MDLYEDALRNWGVDASPTDLIEQATKGYMDIRGEMEALAPLVAAQNGYDTNDYREVIAHLKRDGAIDGDKLLDHYNAVLRDIEGHRLSQSTLFSVAMTFSGLKGLTMKSRAPA